jgi:hypothetical protein
MLSITALTAKITATTPAAITANVASAPFVHAIKSTNIMIAMIGPNIFPRIFEYFIVFTSFIIGTENFGKS